MYISFKYITHLKPFWFKFQINDKNRIIPLAQPFGFAEDGLIQFGFTLNDPTEKAKLNSSACANAGFLLTTQKPQAVEELNIAYKDTCLIEESQSSSIFLILKKIDDFLKTRDEKNLNEPQPPDQIPVPQKGEFSIMYSNCDLENCDVGFTLKVEEMNGSNHLSLGQIPLPILFIVSEKYNQLHVFRIGFYIAPYC